jgi:hypothetical protein
VPAQDQLGRGLAHPVGDRDDLRVVEHSALRQRRPGFDRDLMLGAERAQVRLGQERVHLDLVDSGAGLTAAAVSSGLIWKTPKPNWGTSCRCSA